MASIMSETPDHMAGIPTSLLIESRSRVIARSSRSVPSNLYVSLSWVT